MFRLHKVLEWKERLEEEARARRWAVESRATELAQEAERLRGERRAFPDDAPDERAIEELRAWSRRAELLRRIETSVRARLDAMRDEIERTRAAHIAARREVESLRRLRERQQREERRRRERKMQEVIDDAAARRFLPGTGRKFPDRSPQSEPHERSARGSTPGAGISRAAR